MFGIIGINSISLIALEIIKSNFQEKEIIYIDDNLSKLQTNIDGIYVETNLLGLEEKIKQGAPINLAISFGEKLLRKRKEVFHRLSNYSNVDFPVLNHSTAIISNLASIDKGNIFSFGAIIGHRTQLKSNSVFWSGVVVEHDCVIGESCYLSPNVTVSGFVKVGDCTLIGSGSTILPEVEIGRNCIIGAGSTVTKNIPDNSVVVGVPGKIIRKCE